MTDVQAAIGRAQLRRVRRLAGAGASSVAARYDARLRGLPGAQPARRGRSAGRHAWHLYAVRVQPGAARVAGTSSSAGWRRAGVGTSVHFIPLHHLTWHVGHCGVPPAGLPGADRGLRRDCSHCPCDPDMTDDDVDGCATPLRQIGGATMTRRWHPAADRQLGPGRGAADPDRRSG